MWKEAYDKVGFNIKYFTFNSALLSQVAIVVSANNTAVQRITKDIPSIEKNSWFSQSNPVLQETIFSSPEDINLWKAMTSLVEKCSSPTCLPIFAGLGKRSITKPFLKILSENFLKFLSSLSPKSASEKLNQAIKDFEEGLNKVRTIKSLLKSTLIGEEKIKDFNSTIQSLKSLKEKYLKEKIKIKREYKNLIKLSEISLENLKTKEKEITILEQEIINLENEIKKFSNLKYKIYRFLLKALKKEIPKQEILSKELDKKKNFLRELKIELKELQNNINYYTQQAIKCENNIKKIEEEIYRLDTQIAELEIKLKECQEKRKMLFDLLEIDKQDITSIFPYFKLKNLSEKEKQRIQPYNFPGLKKIQEKNFLNALRVIWWFLFIYRHLISHNLKLLSWIKSSPVISEELKNDEKLMLSLWGTFFIIFPIVSSTFHSIEFLFKEISSKEVFNSVIVDEAGQASSYMPVGIFHRCKHALIIGDPFQLEPITNIPPLLLLHILEVLSSNKNEMEELPFYISGLGKAIQKNKIKLDSSVQIIADRASLYKSIIKVQGEKFEVGIPLRIHFRCAPKIMVASNILAYGDLMVHFKEDSLDGEIIWINVPKNDWNPLYKNCCNFEIKTAIKLLNILLDDNFKNIYILSPFKDVVKVAKEQFKNFYKPNLSIQINTIHSFQGKEADVVILILGGKEEMSKDWVVKNPSLINVALTRAKQKVYFIGNYSLWKHKFPPDFLSLITLLPIS